MKKSFFLILGLLISLQSFAKKIEVYLDYATLPSLNMIFDLVENKSNNDVDRIIGFERFALNKDILSNFPEDKIHFSKVSVRDINEFLNILFSKISESNEKVELVIHTNLDHSLRSLLTVFNKLSPLSDKFTIKKLYLYDDGSANYVDLYQHRDKNIPELLMEAKEKLTLSLQKNSIDLDSLHSLSRYTWHLFYPTEYILLRPDYLDIDEKMASLKKFISDNIAGIKWDRFNQLTENQRALFLNIVNFNKDIYNKLKSIKGQKTFIFTGTTTWDAKADERLKNAKMQTKIFEQFIRKGGKFYLGDNVKVFFKGHPKGDDINEYILRETRAESIPANIPFEVLMMTDLLPDYVGGIMSSTYFSLPKKNIAKIVFLGSDKIKNEADARAQTLSKLMLMLDVISSDQIIFASDLLEKETFLDKLLNIFKK